MTSRRLGRPTGMSDPQPQPTTVSNIGVAMFAVADQDAALAFYTGKLGFELRSDTRFGEHGEMRWLEVAPPGSTDIPLKIGSITLAICCLAAFAAWTARETYRTHMNDLGNRNAIPVPKDEYDRLREEAIAGGKPSKAAA